MDCASGEWEEGEGKENEKKRNRVPNKQRKQRKHADAWRGGADCPEARALSLPPSRKSCLPINDSQSDSGVSHHICCVTDFVLGSSTEQGMPYIMCAQWCVIASVDRPEWFVLSLPFFFRDKLSNIYAPDRQVSDVIKEGGSLGYGAGRGGSYFGYCER